MRHSLLAYAPLRLRPRCPAMLVEIVKLLVDDVGDVGHQGLAVRLTALRRPQDHGPKSSRDRPDFTERNVLELADFSVLLGRPTAAPLWPTRTISAAQAFPYTSSRLHMATARQFITPVTNPDRCGALGCWSQAVAVTGALAICALFFAAAVFAQSVSDSLGELLVGKAAFGDWRTMLPWFGARSLNCPRHTPPDRRRILPE